MSLSQSAGSSGKPKESVTSYSFKQVDFAGENYLVVKGNAKLGLFSVVGDTD